MSIKSNIVLMGGLLAGAVVAEVKPPTEPFLKPGETLACFGDSITAGKNYYIKDLSEALAKQDIKVVNCGLSGDKTPMALTRIQKVADVNPDAVLFFFGANDSVIGRGRWSDEPVVSPTTFRDNLVWMIHWFRLKTKIRRFAIVTPTGRCEGAAIGEFGPILDQYVLAAREAVDIVNSFGARRGDPVVTLVPLDSEFRFYQQANLKDPKGHLLTRDGVHFSRLGSEVAAQVILKSLNLAR